jgi:O-acetyl-ADP-ribose deacetylase (regulator of RNase III)
MTTSPRLILEVGDITGFEADAIVNAANSSLLGGGGVDGAIHRAGGPEILVACRELRRLVFPKGLPTGEAVATTAGLLKARWVIHTVGPVYSFRTDRSHQLSAAYRSCLRVADELGARSVAFPLVSAGVYGWPIESAARIAIGTLENTPTSVREIRFVLRTAAVHEVVAEALARR